MTIPFPSKRLFVANILIILIAALLPLGPSHALFASSDGEIAQDPAAVDGDEPVDPPSGSEGLAIHSERCATCHGNLGLGDGELAAGLPNPPAAHASPDYLREAVPAEMFETITAGRTERGMPPFGSTSSNPLSDIQRWNVIAAIYSLGTPLESLESGREAFNSSCASCHGQDGRGDGPGAAEIDQDPGDLSSLSYWLNISNQQVYDRIQETPEFHTLENADEDLWAIIDYSRTFSYEYVDALAPFRPLDYGSVSGLVTNGTSGDSIPEETVATLRGFTQDLNITLTLTTTLDSESRYSFELTEVPQDWFYRVSVDYAGLDFGSDFGQLSSVEPDLDMPVTVFDPTTNPEDIGIEQVHIILGFDDETVEVGELYVVSNESQAVFVGESGRAADGTFRFILPENAQNIAIQRGFGSVDSFIAANEVIPTDAGFADTLPLRPGSGALNLLVQYSLPYDDEASFSHALAYPTSMVNLVIPDTGVSLENSEEWQDTGQMMMGSNAVSTFSQSALPAGGVLEVALEGRPQTAAAVPIDSNSDNALEILIGLGVFLLAVGAAAVIIRQWQKAAPPPVADKNVLLEEIAALDNAFEAGEINQSEYESERAVLKSELLKIWEDG